MEFIKNSLETIKNKFGSQEKRIKTWESKTSDLSKEYLSDLDNNFTELTAEVLKSKIKYLGKTESGEPVLSSGLSRKELTSPKEIGETEGGGVIYEHSPMYNYIKNASGLIKNWKEKINDEKLSAQEKKILLNQLNLRKENFKNQIFDIRHQITPEKNEKQVLKQVKIFKKEIPEENNKEQELSDCIEKIQQLAENYNQEESSDDSIRQAVVLVGKISKQENTEPKKLISDLQTIFDADNRENVTSFYRHLAEFFEAMGNREEKSVNGNDETTSINNPPLLNT